MILYWTKVILLIIILWSNTYRRLLYYTSTNATNTKMLDLILELILKYLLLLSHQWMTQYVGNNNLLYVYWNYTPFVLLQPTDELNYKE